jgi:hypothetical protein
MTGPTSRVKRVKILNSYLSPHLHTMITHPFVFLDQHRRCKYSPSRVTPYFFVEFSAKNFSNYFFFKVLPDEEYFNTYQGYLQLFSELHVMYSPPLVPHHTANYITTTAYTSLS